MCGICGIYDPREDLTANEPAVLRMTAALAHRGPDGDSHWSSGPVVLGHSRLAIIDIDGGWQPIFDERRTLVLVFNGEIYNFQSLRAQLEDRGHRFATKSDTEVIVHGFEEWGSAVVDRLQGMFAFALWSEDRRELVLARDRLGIKPLYYHRNEQGRVAFASEIKALLTVPWVPRAENRDRLPEYLAFRSVAGPETLFAGIREVQPGQIVTLSGTDFRENTFWRPSQGTGEAALRSRTSDAEATNRGFEMIDEAVRDRLVSEVALGTITSGGIDSSLVTKLAADAQPEPMDTFCAGFDEGAYDERDFARVVSRQIGSRHHELVATERLLNDEFESLTWAHDEPLTHPNSVPMHALYRLAKQDARVTVLLSGEGADEIFGGYDWYRTMGLRDRLSRLPGIGVIRRLPPVGRIATLSRVLREDYPLGCNAITPMGVWEGLGISNADQVAQRAQLWPGHERTLEGLYMFDQRTYLPPLLQRQDRMSMAAGIEARVPFLDHNLVEWANALPSDLKQLGGERKGLLRQIARRAIPQEIIDRPKVGFTVPFGRWMLGGGPIAARVERLGRQDSIVSTLFDADALAHVRAQHREGRDGYADVLWTLVALDVWEDVFLRNEMAETRLPGADLGFNRHRRPDHTAPGLGD